MELRSEPPRDLIELLRLERRAFAAKVRLARAVLGWSQTEFGYRVGLTQRAIHKLEQGDTEPRRATVVAVEQVWRDAGFVFEELADGGFRVTVRAGVIARPLSHEDHRAEAARRQLGVTAQRREG